MDDREDTGALAKDAMSEATIKIHVGDQRFVATGRRRPGRRARRERAAHGHRGVLPVPISSG